MLTFWDIVVQEEFRRAVERRLASGANDVTYSFPTVFPMLYKYQSLSKYAVDNIIEHSITASSIGSFNDLFDGAIHRYGSQKEIELAAEKKWNDLEKLRIDAKLPPNMLSREDYIRPLKSYFQRESRSKFKLADYIGTYVSCFSTQNDSILMWAHYADSQKGICVAYDFNRWEPERLHRQLLFPVAYSPKPINVDDLLDDEKHATSKYPIDEALLCSVLNKFDIWEYEKEWRIVVALSSGKQKLRLPINVFINPSAIYLGYHILKPFFYYNRDDALEKETAANSLKCFQRLLIFSKDNKIPIFLMIPKIGRYQIKGEAISTEKLTLFMSKYFSNNCPESIRYYDVIQNHLLELTEKRL